MFGTNTRIIFSHYCVFVSYVHHIFPLDRILKCHRWHRRWHRIVDNAIRCCQCFLCFGWQLINGETVQPQNSNIFSFFVIIQFNDFWTQTSFYLALAMLRISSGTNLFECQCFLTTNVGNHWMSPIETKIIHIIIVLE